MWHYACYFVQVQTALELFVEPGLLFLSNELMEEVFFFFFTYLDEVLTQR